MKKLIPTLVVVVILIAGWVYAANQNYFREEEAVQAKLLGISSADIQAITLHEGTEDKSGTGSDSDAVSTLELKDGVWHMTEPKNYPLNEYSVGSWLDAMSSADQEMVVEESPKDVEKYGLGAAATRLDIKLKDGREFKIAIGSQLPAGDGHYVQVNSGAVVAVKNDAVTNIALTRRQLLDTTPFNMDESNVRTLEWEGEASSWMLKASAEGDTASEHTWTLNGKSIKAEDAISLISQIKNLTTADDVRKASDVKDAIPRSTLSVQQQVNGKETTTVYRLLTTSSEPDTIWVITPDEGWAYTMDAASLKEVEKVAEKLKTSAASSEPNTSETSSEK
ncbi:DUF4340 domain-containing protein [Paenibacillus polysaccharolyticus]|uniref:DUF4340 domain-containing protein n=1 Tax=Paenibacillus polysaccharolyticus TaxID=582692 RepID=UPI00203B2744|nr:DUF4340 domain-containing protein [Paenibacillus polysaccharolyticus]MCM3134610.1 DUF4340 domain-containing protein [Paenibacillus polysaccharolyticus]